MQGLWNGSGTLGILAFSPREDVPAFSELNFFRSLSIAGRREGIRVIVFSPQLVSISLQTVSGFEYVNGRWRKGVFPLPRVVYDRCFLPPAYRHYSRVIRALRNLPHVTFLGKGLSGKWDVYQRLASCPQLAPYLPETHRLTDDLLLSRLAEKKDLLIKPAAGTHGKGVLKISTGSAGYSLLGRDLRNQPVREQLPTSHSLIRFLRTFTAGKAFIMQPFLHLQTSDGNPFDVRILVQKDECGTWQETGRAVRLGSSRNITSNLHGGGRAVPYLHFLQGHFSAETCQEINSHLNVLAEHVPPLLEASHGRLVELGIDAGIDKEGKVWLLEVNSKPGRQVFRHINDTAARLASISRPVKYAQFLMRHV